MNRWAGGFLSRINGFHNNAGAVGSSGGRKLRAISSKGTGTSNVKNRMTLRRMAK